jgi:hypothetical protein
MSRKHRHAHQRAPVATANEALAAFLQKPFAMLTTSRPSQALGSAEAARSDDAGRIRCMHAARCMLLRQIVQEWWQVERAPTHTRTTFHAVVPEP